MLSKTSQAYGMIETNRHKLLHGTVVAIDPSVGSNSSMPGYAVYLSGRLIDSGIFEIHPVTDPLWIRLRKLSHHLRKLYRQFPPDVLVYEEIAPQRYGGGGNANAHSSLIKAVGVVLSISGPEGFVGLMPISWKRLVRDTYIKSDSNDAKEMGWIAINEAGKMPESRGYGRRNRKVPTPVA